MAAPDSPALLPPAMQKHTENLIKRVHFLYKAFYGPWPLLRYIYFSISHIKTSGLLPGDPLEAFSFINFSHQFYYLEWAFTLRVQPDPPRPLSALSASATMKNYSSCRPLFLLFPLLSSSSARKGELQDKLMDILGHLKSGLRKMQQIL